MIHRNLKGILILSILLSLTLFSVSIPSCEANYANWGLLYEGSTFHNGTHISMPHADVRINITRAVSALQVSMNSEFHIETPITQNATLAFVYPMKSDDLIPISTTTTSVYPNESLSMEIYGNGSLINYTILSVDDVVANGFVDSPEDIYEYTSMSVNFALFDIELIGNTTLVLSTITLESYGVTLDRFDYDYIVGSARTFEGHTMEQVRIRVTEEVPFASKSFSPNESLTIVENDITTEATWDINSTVFSADSVHFSAMVGGQGIDWISTIGQTAGVIFIVLLIYQFAYKKSKRGSV